jgi:hypothetical protein
VKIAKATLRRKRDPAKIEPGAAFHCSPFRRAIWDRPLYEDCPWDPMTTFDDREKGFEKKFALDQEQEFKAHARRNRALGQWAAGLMGLEGAHVDEYAKAVVKSDFELPGDDDVFRKVFEDLKGSGVAVTEGEVRMKMAELLAQAREGVRNGG